MSLEVHIKKKLKNFLLNIAFSSNGEVLGILGQSGCGKSMTLKSIAGIVTPDSGKIFINNRILFNSSDKINVCPQKRNVGYLFQNYALFPNMSVEENISCSLNNIKDGKVKKINELISKFHLNGFQKKFPHELSGGQQQRVALARILAYEPNAILLDEPFSSLDSNLKEQLQIELLSFIREYSGDVIFVSHNHEEIYGISEKLLIFENGEVVAFGNTKEIFDNPETLSAAKLTGCKNISKAIKKGVNNVYAHDWGINLTTNLSMQESSKYIGIKPNSFRPVSKISGILNEFPITIKKVLEGPFQYNICFTKKGMENSPPLWWTAQKDMLNNNLPEFLEVEPHNVLPLI